MISSVAIRFALVAVLLAPALPATTQAQSGGGWSEFGPAGPPPKNPAGRSPRNPTGRTPRNPAGPPPLGAVGRPPLNPTGATPRDPAGPAPIGAVGRAPFDPVGRAPLNPAGTTPRDPVGPPPLDPTGPAPVPPSFQSDRAQVASVSEHGMEVPVRGSFYCEGHDRGFAGRDSFAFHLERTHGATIDDAAAALLQDSGVWILPGW